jgi:hypothetical protein
MGRASTQPAQVTAAPLEVFSELNSVKLLVVEGAP